MAKILRFETSDVTPQREAVLEHQGVPIGRTVSADIDTLFDMAISLFAEFADPVGMLKGISKDRFAEVYQGEARNQPQTPVGDIFRQADRLALFVVTLGQRINAEVRNRFESNDFALGCMLDAAASVAADKLAEVVERSYLNSLLSAGEVGPDARAMRYSPGYCGWHISGQGTLFTYLKPRAIGISLRDSFLMDPLKSVSGVVLIGSKQMHDFDDTYLFCSECTTRGCRERIAALEVE